MSNQRPTTAKGINPQPADAFDRFAAVYDLLGFSRFTPLAIRTCTDFLADSNLAVSRLLDLGCGTGHFAIAMAEKGITVTGIDGAAAMLKRARANAGRMKNAPRWRQGDFRTFDAGGTFDLVTCWFDSLNHLVTDAELTRCFRRVRRHLTPGGAFVFDVNTPLGLREYWSASEYRSTSGFAMIKRLFSEPTGDHAWLELEAFVKRGKYYERLKIPFFQRGLNERTLRACLEAARFRDIDVTSFRPDIPLVEAGRLLVSAWR